MQESNQSSDGSPQFYYNWSSWPCPPALPPLLFPFALLAHSIAWLAFLHPAPPSLPPPSSYLPLTHSNFPISSSQDTPPASLTPASNNRVCDAKERLASTEQVLYFIRFSITEVN
ncbi:expressed unknown protein [Seminavis robusta]|uniref:Uncharacterized protein n=1 Tax=Seminavis robusta TaxID=568900 RepID=A0A9N8H2A0_9STRA|nr:expressed unknown protein [Seminavis robusta]|eukprot:Sro6_g004812.1  (115) ;mRNA; f:18202-18546